MTSIFYYFLLSSKIKRNQLYIIFTNSNFLGGKCQDKEELGDDEGDKDSDGAPQDDDGERHAVRCENSCQVTIRITNCL